MESTWIGKNKIVNNLIVKECPNCHQIRAVDTYCSNCGAKLMEEPFNPKFKLNQKVKSIFGVGKIINIFYDDEIYYRVSYETGTFLQKESDLEPFTGRDYVNCLSNKDLANFFANEQPYCNINCGRDKSCYECALEWLKAPYEESEED